MMHGNLLEYRRYRYLKLALLLIVTAVVAYALHHPPLGTYGGTWLGYVLGSVSAVIVGLLLWLGIRKRSYASAGSMQGWLSAHVYLGSSLIVLATLHTGFKFGWNVHTLAYLLMLGVISNGFYGLYAYLRFPRKLTENLGEDSFDNLLQEIAKIDELAHLNALQLPDEIVELVRMASKDTRIGGNVLEQLRRRHPNCPTTIAVKKLHELGSKGLKGSQVKIHRELYVLMLRREALVARARRDIMLKARLKIWLYIHVPLSMALLCALLAHIISIFFYW
jgi:hypothetical protein